MSDSPSTVVEARGLHVSLGGLPVLKDVSVTVRAGDVIALMGGNGSGKTTLVRALLGLVPHQRGSVALFGVDLSSFREWLRIAYVPQRSALSMQQATATEIVATGRLARRRLCTPPRRTDRQAVAAALLRVGMSEHAGTQFVRLSGGQQQRVLIARALVAEPELLVLDEPLAGVDVRAQQDIVDVVTELHRAGLTVLVVLHELGPFDALLTRAVLLREGRVISDGPMPSHGPGGHETMPPADPLRLLLGALDEEG